MKKVILSAMLAIGVLASAASSYAQGTINFNNSGFNISTNNGTSSGVMSGVKQYIFGLYLASDAGSLAGVTTPVMLFTNSPAAGVIAASQYTLNGYASGGTYAFQVKGWSATGGYGSYDAALAAIGSNPTSVFGKSGIGTVTLGGGAVLPGVIWGNGAGQIQGFTLTPVPEPSTIALAGLGAASLLLFRRRK